MRTVPRLLSPFTHPTLPSSPRDHLQWPLAKTSPPHGVPAAGCPFPGHSPSSWLLWCSTHPGIPPTLLLHLLTPLPLLGFPDGPSSKEPVCQCRRQGRSLGEGNGNPLQYSCLENPMGRRAWWATVGHDWSGLALPLLGLGAPRPLNSALCIICCPHSLGHLNSSVALCSAVCDNSPRPLLWWSSPYFQLPALYSHLSPQPFISKVEHNTFPTKTDSCPQI